MNQRSDLDLNGMTVEEALTDIRQQYEKALVEKLNYQKLINEMNGYELLDLYCDSVKHPHIYTRLQLDIISRAWFSRGEFPKPTNVAMSEFEFSDW